MTTTHIELDIAIIGGGIAGLWLLNRFNNSGYQCHLFEQTALGSDQSVGSQGMIHGGIKYTLAGTLSGASEAIADMPAHWRDCLNGKGDVDLRQAQTLSDHFYMWSSASVTSRLTTFFASKATRGRVDKVSKKDRPAIFQNDQFSGNLYKLVDMVLDVPSVVQALANNYPGKSHLIDWSQARLEKHQNRARLIIDSDSGEQLQIDAKQFIFSAGRGNSELMQQLGITSPEMQTRPLQQVMVKLDCPHPFFGHCLGADKTPRLTISSHPLIEPDGSKKWVWYLGGSLSEKGANQSREELLAAAQKELRELMPWLDLSCAEWATLPIDRAEPRQKNLLRPDKAFIGRASGIDNVCIAWPTKLTLAPNLANETLELIESLKLEAADNNSNIDALAQLPSPPLAATPWHTAFSQNS